MPSTGSVSNREQSVKLTERVKAWLHNEKQRQEDRRERKRSAKRAVHQALHMHCPPGELMGSGDIPAFSDSSSDEEAHNSLNQLEAILAAARASSPAASTRRRSVLSRRGSSGRPRARSLMGNASDTDYSSDGEPVVPSCEVYLKTVEEVGIDEFKRQVLTLAHTLKCKNWRKVPLDRFEDISIGRISGALTNSVSLSLIIPTIWISTCRFFSLSKKQKRHSGDMRTLCMLPTVKAPVVRNLVHTALYSCYVRYIAPHS